MVKPLLEVESGKRVKVVSINAGRMLRSRLDGLGIIPGTTIRVLKNGWGPVLVEVMGRKIAIGRGQAEKIEVEELD